MTIVGLERWFIQSKSKVKSIKGCSTRVSVKASSMWMSKVKVSRRETRGNGCVFCEGTSSNIGITKSVKSSDDTGQE